jgi:hypothetical protein
MDWFRKVGRKALVGYATKSGECKEFDGSFTDSIFNIDEQSFEDQSGTSRRGVIVLVFDKGNEPETPEEKCLGWIRSQPSDNSWPEELPPCPCTESSASVDERFDLWSQADGPRNCYIYMMDQRPEHTKTCCYFRRGFWSRGALITRARTAGRANRYEDSN